MTAASRLLPPHLSAWSRAMASELTLIEDDRSALLFACGCLRASAALAIGARLKAFPAMLFPPAPSPRSLPAMIRFLSQPRSLGLLCGTFAVGMGMAYMQAAGAPSRYLLVNFAALVLGATAWLALARTAGSRLAGAGPAVLALSVPLLLTALFGVAADGASRWVDVGPLSLQSSLIVLPVMTILYARRPDSIGTAGMIVAALALALQPDRAMAGVLLAALLALLLAAPGRLPAAAAAAAALALAWTLRIPDSLPASPYVDRILYTSFDVHPLAGAAVLIGAAALLVPALLAARRGGGAAAALLAFGGCWSAVLAAAALDNYPTPLVGYSGSAVLGYLLSVALLPSAARGADAAASAARAVTGPDPDPTLPELRAASPA
jgi:cell division protein FtsW (lipid II flippase)